VIHCIDIPQDTHEQLKEMCLVLADTVATHQRYYNCNVEIGDVEVNPWLRHNSHLKKIEEFIVSQYETVYGEFTTKHGIQWWINKYGHGVFQEPHDHLAHTEKMREVCSWCYFVDIPNNSGTFVATVDNDTKLEYNNEGCVIFFPSDMVHEVTPNQTHNERVTVAGNIIVRI